MGDKKDKGLGAISTSWLGRNAKSSAMALKVAATMGTGAIKRAVSGGEGQADKEAAAALELLTTMGQLKGAVMKVGQMISYMDTALPESWRGHLEDLQDRTPPVDPESVARLIEAELGRRPEALFARWEPMPFAAASIGQVHRATDLEGREVAVKVQYPGIVKALKSDLRNASIVNAITGPAFRAVDSKGIVGEIRDRLLEECDYRQEADNLDHFAALWAKEPMVAFPEVVRELSTERVLTTGFVDGLRFKDFAASASQAERDAAGRTIFRLAFGSIFKHLIFNCDPHPGNYLFRDGEVVFLDFGCVKRFDQGFVDGWKALMRAALENDRPRFDHLMRASGMAKEGFDYAHHFEIVRYLYRPWLHDRPFRYTHTYVSESFRLMIGDNPNKFKMDMPRDWVFVNRLQWGLNSVLASLEAEGDWRSIMLDLIYAPGEPRPAPFP